MTDFKMRSAFDKYVIIVYGMIFAISIAAFFKANYFKLAYSTNLAYRAHYNIAKLGLARLRDNETQLTNVFIIGVLIVGALIGLYVTLHRNSSLFITLNGIIVFIGSLIPLLPPYDENLIARVWMAVWLIAVSVALQVFLIHQRVTF